VRFILTCNYPHKIIAPIHSRCQGFHIVKTDKQGFINRVIDILDKENVTFGDELASYIDATYPDLRKCLNLVQLNSQSGDLKAPSAADKSARDWRLECVDLFKRGKVRDARAVLCQNSNPEEAEDVFRWMYDNLDLWGDTPERQDQAIVIIRNGLVNNNSVADVEINLSATLIELAGIS
jgi:replication factor C small subunit